MKKAEVTFNGFEMIAVVFAFWFFGWLFLHDLVDYAIKHWPK